MNITLKIVLLFVLRTCKTVSRNTCMNIEDMSNISQLSYISVVVTRTMKFLSVVTPTYIYHGLSIRKTFLEEISH